MEDQFAAAGCRVHAFAQALKADLAGGESIYGFDEMLQGTAEPVQLPHDQGVPVAGVINGFSQASARIDDAAGNITEDLFTPTVYMVAYFSGGAAGSLVGAYGWSRGGWHGFCLAAALFLVSGLLAFSRIRWDPAAHR